MKPQRFPTILPLPKHRRFRYEPRFYDPVKEDIKQREKFAAAEKRRRARLKAEGKDDEGFSEGQALVTKGRISAEFRKNVALERQSVWLRIAIVIVLTVVIYLYLNDVLEALM